MWKVRFALSVTERWNQDEGHFNYETFYWQMVDFFESDPEDECVTEILEYWNECVIISIRLKY